jgi:hypothetical protein
VISIYWQKTAMNIDYDYKILAIVAAVTADGRKQINTASEFTATER